MTTTNADDSIEMTMLEAINHTLHLEMARDDRTVLFGQDVGVNGGVFRATDGLHAAFGADRVVDTPLSEAAIAGTAVGLAAAGLIPLPEIQFLGFAYQAMHQIAGQIARMRFRSDGRLPMPITVRSPFGGGVRTPELHSDSLEGQFANLPGLKVVMPATAADAKGLLASSIRDPDPVLFLEPLRGYRAIKDEVPQGEHLSPIGAARTARGGDDIVIIAWSHAVSVAERVASDLAADGVSVAVLDLRTLNPLDIDSLAAAVSHCGRAVVVEEAAQTGGFAGEIVATINEECFYDLEAPVRRVSGYDTPYPVGQLEDDYIPTTARLAQGVRQTLDLAP